MRIHEFIDKYCQDLVDKQRETESLISLEGFPHDDVLQDEEGRRVPVVCVDGLSIPVYDFLALDKKDFLIAYQTPGSEEAFDNYVSALTILEGEEAVSRIRNAILNEAKRLEKDFELVSSI